MNINLIRLRSDLADSNAEMIKENSNYIEDLNNELIDEDILISEKAKNSLIDLIFVESGGSEMKFKKIINKLQDPIILLSNGKNNSFAASLEIKTYCALNHRLCFFLTGMVDQVSNAIIHIARVINTYHSVKETNLGVIGKPSDWLISYKQNNKKFHNIFSINLVDIEMEEFFQEIDKKELIEDIPHYNQLQNKYADKETLNGALYIYSAIKRLVNKYNLKGLTVRCFDLLEKYKNTSCLALALLNEEGIVSTCEGDIPALITMYLLHSLTGSPVFQANPSDLSFEDGTLLLAHCTLPLNMVSKYELLTHFESNLGIGIKGELPLGNVTICKICPDFKLRHDVCFASEIIENCSLPGYCRTQIKVKLSEEGMMTFLKEDFGNHLIITYNDVTDDFIPLLNLIRATNAQKSKNKNKK